MRRERSQRLLARANRLLPGGVNSPVRAYRAVGGDPVFMARGSGPHIYDVDGNRYLDYVCSYGPLILGHAPPTVIAALVAAAQDGTSFGATTIRELELAERVLERVPSMDQLRFVSSGTEATMSALRVARGFTGRDLLVKFAGCYHGHADVFLTEAGSGVATLGIPGSAGIPAACAADTLTLPYNDVGAVEELMRRLGDRVAAIIVEPIACNMGLVEPVPGFLATLRHLCDQHGTVLIFDEVITGFRVAAGGAQELLGIRADMTTLGKIIGGGLPVGAYGGRADIMACVAPLGPVYQAGTLSGNPVAMASGLAALEALEQEDAYTQLEARAAQMQAGLEQVLAQHGHPARLSRVGSIFHLWCVAEAEGPPKNYDDIKRGNSALFAALFQGLLAEGVAIAPSSFEVGFISLAHQGTQIDATVSVFDSVLSRILPHFQRPDGHAATANS